MQPRQRLPMAWRHEHPPRALEHPEPRRLEHRAEVAAPVIVVHECALAVARALDHEVHVAGEVESGEAGHGSRADVSTDTMVCRRLSIGLLHSSADPSGDA